MVYLFRDNLKSIEQLSEPEVKLAGLRLNPDLYTKSRTNYYNNVMISKMDQIDKSAKQIKGLPKNPKLANIKWSPDQTKIAMTNTKEEGVELWFIDLEKLRDIILNLKNGKRIEEQELIDLQIFVSANTFLNQHNL